MKLIVGLGNPGNKYAKSRHNIGFMVVDALAKELKLEWKHQKNIHAETAKGDGIILLKPQTFMNNSGLAVRATIKKMGIKLNDILVVFDDLDMATGKIRYRDDGSSGGHRGMQSLINYLNTEAIKRVKIGIGFPIKAMVVAGANYAARAASMEKSLTSAHVLGKFTTEQSKKIKIAIPEAINMINKKFLA